VFGDTVDDTFRSVLGFDYFTESKVVVCHATPPYSGGYYKKVCVTR